MAVPEMTGIPRVKIIGKGLDPGDATVLLEGVDITACVTKVVITMEVKRANRAEITILADLEEVSIEAETYGLP